MLLTWRLREQYAQDAQDAEDNSSEAEGDVKSAVSGEAAGGEAGHGGQRGGEAPGTSIHGGWLYSPESFLKNGEFHQNVCICI